MLPFALKVVWFTLSLSGLVCCWIVLVCFANVVQIFWSPILYCLGITLVEGVFCLGMIWKMDPFEMPRPFRIAQAVIMCFGSFLLTGVAASCTVATTYSSFRPANMAGFTLSTLAWHSCYLLFVAIFPLLASSGYTAVLLRLDATTPTDNLHFDAADPEWVRLIGYAGIPLLLCIPCFFLSVATAFRIARNPTYSAGQSQEHSQYGRNLHSDNFTQFPMRKRFRIRSKASMEFTTNVDDVRPSGEDPTPSPHPTIPTPRAIASPPSSIVLATPHLQSPGRAPTDPDVSARLRKYHLPFTHQPQSMTCSSPDLRLQSPSIRSSTYFPSDSSVSSVFPTFAPPSRSQSVRETIKSFPAFPDPDNMDFDFGSKEREGDGDMEMIVSSTAVDGDEERWHRNSTPTTAAKSALDYGMEDEDDDMDDDWVRPTYVRRDPLAKMLRGDTAPAVPKLLPAIWRIVLFQIMFFSIQVLASTSTLIDVTRQRSTPAPFGTQHVALLLGAWGPCFVFGHMPEVRERLTFWKKRWPS